MVDIAIVAVFLALTMALGIRGGVGKPLTMQEFALAGKSCSTVSLTATLVATYIGGGTIIGFCGKVFSSGLFYIVGFGYALAVIPLAYIFIRNNQKFSKMISMGDIMESFYGTAGKVSVGIFGTLGTVAFLGAQIVAMGYVLNILFGFPHLLGLVTSAAIIVFYAAFGGIRAIVSTDILQFAIFIVAIPIIFGVGVYYAGGFGEAINAVPASHWSIVPKSLTIPQYLSLFLVWWLPFAVPPIIQRFLMASSSSQATAAARYAFFIMLLISIFMTLIGLVALGVVPQDTPENMVTATLLNIILPTGLKGFVVAGLLAVVMSTADSLLNSAAICFVHDAIKPIFCKKIPESIELKYTKIATVILGVAAIWVAVKFTVVLELMFLAHYMWAPLIFVPFFAGLLGFRASSSSFIIGAVFAAITFIFWQWYSVEATTGLAVLLPGLVANSIGFFGSHYICSKNG